MEIVFFVTSSDISFTTKSQIHAMIKEHIANNQGNSTMLKTTHFIKAAATVLAMTAASSAFAQTTYLAGDDSKASQLCVAVATGNKHQVRNQVSGFKPTTMIRQNYRMVVNNVTCNGQDLVNFALNTGNYPIAEKLSKYRQGNVQIKDIAKQQKMNGTVITTAS